MHNVELFSQKIKMVEQLNTEYLIESLNFFWFSFYFYDNDWCLWKKINRQVDVDMTLTTIDFCKSYVTSSTSLNYCTKITCDVYAIIELKPDVTLSTNCQSMKFIPIHIFFIFRQFFHEHFVKMKGCQYFIHRLASHDFHSNLSWDDSKPWSKIFQGHY